MTAYGGHSEKSQQIYIAVRALLAIKWRIKESLVYDMVKYTQPIMSGSMPVYLILMKMLYRIKNILSMEISFLLSQVKVLRTLLSLVFILGMIVAWLVVILL